MATDTLTNNREGKSASMASEFTVIDDYLKHRDVMNDEDCNWDYEHTVPSFQTHSSTEDMDYSDLVRTDETLESILQGVKESHTNCTYVPDAQEHQLNVENKQLHDLDQPFYDNIPDKEIKPSNERIKPVTGCADDLLLENEYIQDFEKVLVTQVKRDILNEAVPLNISVDPTFWTPADVNKWIEWMCTKYDLPVPNMTFFEMNGISLCMLSESDFIWKSSDAGSTLYNQLEIWKNACKLTDFSLSCNIPHPVHETTVCPPLPSVSPTPSVDSSSSDESVPYKSFPQRQSSNHHKQTIHLWQFIKELLKQPENFGHCVKWLDRSRGIFKVEDSCKFAKEWGMRKNRPKMNYDKLSRSIRQYYRKGIIKKTELSKRLVYQFCPAYL